MSKTGRGGEDGSEQRALIHLSEVTFVIAVHTALLGPSELDEKAVAILTFDGVMPFRKDFDLVRDGPERYILALNSGQVTYLRGVLEKLERDIAAGRFPKDQGIGGAST